MSEEALARAKWLTEIEASMPHIFLDAVQEELTRTSNSAHDGTLKEVERYAKDAARLEKKVAHLRYEADFPILRHVQGFVVQQVQGIATMVKQIRCRSDDRERESVQLPPSDIGGWIPSQIPLGWKGGRPSWLIMVEEEAKYIQDTSRSRDHCAGRSSSEYEDTDAGQNAIDR
jgi:hypothetical protein